MPDDIDQIKKLPAEERLKKLKELTKKREEEIKAAQTLMKKSESELVERKETEEKIPIPQMISEELQTLTTDEERDMFKVHRQMGRREEKLEENKTQQKQTLEEAIETEKERLQEQRTVAQPDYLRAIEEASRRPVHELYAEMARIKTSVEQQGYISREQMSQVNYLSRANELKAETGYKPEHAAAKEMTLVQMMGDKLQGMYRAQSHAPEQIRHGYRFEEGDTQYSAN